MSFFVILSHPGCHITFSSHWIPLGYDHFPCKILNPHQSIELLCSYFCLDCNRLHICSKLVRSTHFSPIPFHAVVSSFIKQSNTFSIPFLTSPQIIAQSKFTFHVENSVSCNKCRVPCLPLNYQTNGFTALEYPLCFMYLTFHCSNLWRYWASSFSSYIVEETILHVLSYLSTFFRNQLI